MGSPLRFGLLASAAVVVAARNGAADTPRVSALGWVRQAGAESCMGTRELAQAVEQRLGRPVFVSAAAAEVFIEGRIEPAASPPGFHAHLALASQGGDILGMRDLDTREASCRAFDEELALVVALLIDPNAALTAPGAPRLVPTPPPPQVIHERVLIPVFVERPSPPPGEPWGESVGVGPVFAAGLLPGASAGVSLRGEITPPRLFPIDVGGAVWLDAATDVAGRGATLSLSYGFLSLCPLTVGTGGTRLRACGGVQVGAIRASGHGFLVSGGQEHVVVQPALEGRLTRRLLGPLELGIGLGVAFPLVRTRLFYLDGSGAEQELYRTGAVAGILDASLGVALP